MLNDNEKYYCINCNKYYKNNGTLLQHLKSKLHIKNVNNSILENNTIQKIVIKPIVEKQIHNKIMDIEPTKIEDKAILNVKDKLNKVIQRESVKKCRNINKINIVN